jgi:hypothetical protein
VKRYRVEAELESPLVIRRERQSSRSEGAETISGTLLRGAFARVWLQRHGAPNASFDRLFLDEPRRFPCRRGFRFQDRQSEQNLFRRGVREPIDADMDRHGPPPESLRFRRFPIAFESPEAGEFFQILAAFA